MLRPGIRYIGPSGASVIVTRGGPGRLTDGERELQLPDGGRRFTDEAPAADRPWLPLGKRYRPIDGMVEVLVVKAGACDLRHNGEPMQQFGGAAGLQGAAVPRRPSPGGLSGTAEAMPENTHNRS